MSVENDKDRSVAAQHKVVIMHNFSYDEINAIIAAVRTLYKDKEDIKKQLVFAKSTEKSLKMRLSNLIEDMCEDHDYLRKNPPNIKQESSADSKDAKDANEG